MEESTAVTTSPQPLPSEVVEKIVISGDLTGLNASQRAEYYGAVCRSLGLNPLTKPFEYLNLNGKLRLYALRDCADQLRRLHGISIYIANRERISDIYIVTARAKDRQGREDESTGAVTVGNLKGDALANALMKAETKAKRRVTLSIAGLGWLDETELETIPQGHPTAIARPDPAGELPPTADQISALVEMARSCGVSLGSFGDHMRQLMNLSEETKITKKVLRETMTMQQFKNAWDYYNGLLKEHIEADIMTSSPSDQEVGPAVEPSPSDTGAASVPTGEGQGQELFRASTPVQTPTDRTYATPQQIAGLRHLAKQIGDEAHADVQDMLAHHPEGLVIGMYEIIRQRLKARRAAQKEEAAAERKN